MQTNESLTEQERGIIEIVRYNRANKLPPLHDVKWRIFGMNFHFRHKSKKELWGRFGGGWNWKLGIQIGGHTAVISLLVCELTVSITEEVR